MDQVVSDHARLDHAHVELDELVSAPRGGVILVTSNGEIAWMDEGTRRRVNGGLQDLVLPIRKSDGPAIDCFVAAVEVVINGKREVVYVVQETGDQREGAHDLIAAIEAVMADTSWLTRTLIEKVRAWRQAKLVVSQASDIDLLSGREREVLGLICEGRSDAEMSRILRLSQNTVRNHVAALYRKIGVNRRSAAIIWARERAITSQEVMRHRRSRPPARAR